MTTQSKNYYLYIGAAWAGFNQGDMPVVKLDSLPIIRDLMSSRLGSYKQYFEPNQRRGNNPRAPHWNIKLAVPKEAMTLEQFQGFKERKANEIKQAQALRQASQGIQANPAIPTAPSVPVAAYIPAEPEEETEADDSLPW